MAAATTKARTSTKQAPKAEPQTQTELQAPETEPQTQTKTQAEITRELAPNTSTVWVSYIKPIGSTTTGFSFPGRDSVKVLVDGEFKKFSQDAGWFDIWDSRDGSNPVGNDFNALLQEHDSVWVKLYWEWSSRQNQLLETNEYNERTGKGYKKIIFRNPPKRRVLAYDILRFGKKAPSQDAEAPEAPAYGADCDNQEEIPF